MSNDPSLDELRAYAAQMGLLGNQPTVVDPSLDRFAQSQDPLQQYAAQQDAGQAHSTLDFAIPGTDIDIAGLKGQALQAIGGVANNAVNQQMPAKADLDTLQKAGGVATGAGTVGAGTGGAEVGAGAGVAAGAPFTPARARFAMSCATARSFPSLLASRSALAASLPMPDQ